MQFWVSLFFAACIWFVVRYIVLQVKQNESGTSSSKTRIKRKARSKIYENLHKLSEYLDDESYPKTAVPWKAFVKQFGNSELKNDIDFDGRPAKLLKLFENVFEIIKTERTYLAVSIVGLFLLKPHFCCFFVLAAIETATRCVHRCHFGRQTIAL